MAMAKVLKVPASDAMLEDLKELQKLLGASSMTEAVRRAVASEIILRRRLKDGHTLRLRGKNTKQGADEVEVIVDA